MNILVTALGVWLVASPSLHNCSWLPGINVLAGKSMCKLVALSSEEGECLGNDENRKLHCFMEPGFISVLKRSYVKQSQEGRKSHLRLSL